MFDKLVRVIKNPKKILIYLASKGLIPYDDKKYLEFIYKEHIGKELNLDSPKTFNEKLQWLKLYDRNPLYTKLVDKYEARKIIKDKVGEEYLIPLLAVYDRPSDIDFNRLPQKFVLKTTHDSGGVVVCQDKDKLDKKKALKKIKKSFRRKYFYLRREWPYKDVTPRIIAEEYMEDNPGKKELTDYKFLCFDGEPKLMYVVVDRTIGAKQNYYDMDFKKVNIQQCYPNTDKEIEKPKNFAKMVSIAKKLSKGIPHIRVDFYEVEGRVYVGELTLYDSAGMEKFDPPQYDEILGSYIDLDKVKRR